MTTEIITNNETLEDTVVILDGVRMIVKNVNLDENGQKNSTEIIQSEKGLREITQPTEIGEALRELNQDILDESTRMSTIDMKSRLKDWEIPSLLAIDALVALKVLPPKVLSLTRQKKRLNVSIGGQGRRETVDTIVGERAQQAKTGGMLDRVKNFFGGGSNWN